MELVKTAMHYICTAYDVDFQNLAEQHEDVVGESVNYLVDLCCPTLFTTYYVSKGAQSLCISNSRKQIRLP